MARPGKGPMMAQNMDGSQEARRRLQVILETISGAKSVTDACEELDIGKTAFFDLRNRVLQASVDELEPRPAGRPGKEVTPEEQEIARLKSENDELRDNLKIAHVREEIMLAMPEVFDPDRAQKKSDRPKADARKKRQRKLQKKSRKRARRS